MADADKRLRQLLAEVTILARDHGHTSDEVNEFLIKHMTVPEFLDLSTVILVMMKRAEEIDDAQT